MSASRRAAGPARAGCTRRSRSSRCGLCAHDCRGFFFDDVGDAGVGVVAADGSDGRGREDDIADQPQPDEENVQMPIYFSIVASSMSMTGMSSLIG